MERQINSNRTRNRKPRTDQQSRLHRRAGTQLKFIPTIPSLVSQKAVVLNCRRGGGRGGSGRVLLALTAAQLPLLQNNVAHQEMDQAEERMRTTLPNPEIMQSS